MRKMEVLMEIQKTRSRRLEEENATLKVRNSSLEMELGKLENKQTEEYWQERRERRNRREQIYLVN